MSAVPPPDATTLARIARSALDEDLGERGDVTTRALFPEPRTARAVLLARASLVVAGLPVAGAVFRLLDPDSRLEGAVHEGTAVRAGTVLTSIRADLRALLEGERTALNFVQRLSGIATATREAVREVEGTGAAAGTPTPARAREPKRLPGRFGFTITAASGSSAPGRW